MYILTHTKVHISTKENDGRKGSKEKGFERERNLRSTEAPACPAQRSQQNQQQGARVARTCSPWIRGVSWDVALPSAHS